MFTTILFPFDHSLESQNALTLAGALVGKFASRLVILTVTPAEGSTPESIEATRTLQSEAQAQLAVQGITAEAWQRAGLPAFVICDVAEELSADLIVMGCRGLALTEEQAESVSSRVVSLAGCPVLLVH